MGLVMVNRVWEEGDQVKEEGGGGQNVDACERWDTIKQNSFRRKEYIYLLPNHILPPVCPKSPQRKHHPRPGKLSPPAVVSTSAGIFFRSRFKVQPSRSASRKSERASVRERERERERVRRDATQHGAVQRGSPSASPSERVPSVRHRRDGKSAFCLL